MNRSENFTQLRKRKNCFVFCKCKYSTTFIHYFRIVKSVGTSWNINYWHVFFRAKIKSQIFWIKSILWSVIFVKIISFGASLFCIYKSIFLGWLNYVRLYIYYRVIRVTIKEKRLNLKKKVENKIIKLPKKS